MRRTLLLLATAALTLTAAADGGRPLHYRPDGGSVVTTDGTARFNRALYGAHTGFRLECSDRPEFGIYLPGMGGNLRFELPAAPCTARYTAGRMTYEQGGIVIEAQVLRSADAALWRIENRSDRPQRIGVRFGGISGQKFSRNGDLGVDDPTCFDFKAANCAGNTYQTADSRIRVGYTAQNETRAVTLVIPFDRQSVDSLPSLQGELLLAPRVCRYLAYFPAETAADTDLAELFARAEQERQALTDGFRIETPDPWLNPVAGALCVAADGIWSGRTWLHGAIGWRTEHLGWRGAYAGDALGWHERARTHFTTYAANQVTDTPPSFDHPRLDSTLQLARAEKRWGTPMYSDGYICRRPGKREMSHYDMNLVYIDALLRHLRATGDTVLMRELFPVIDRHLQWEKRNFDPDGDHLYDGYCCIWASDALYYGGGAVTHASAYNYFANRETARIAALLGLDPTPYRAEAEAIRRAMHERLWDAEGNHWAEYRDATGLQRLHTSAALWTIYHAIDSETGDPLEAAASALYALRELPQLPVRIDGPAAGLDNGPYSLPATTSWQPYAWSINNVAVAEVLHTALACWQAGWDEEAFRLLKSTAIDNMYLGASPLNFGQISFLDAARGECYRDFADPIGCWARALTEGLFGIRPDLPAGRVLLAPGFPDAWEQASVGLPDIAYRMERSRHESRYTIDSRYPAGTRIELVIPASRPRQILVNGRPAAWSPVEEAIGKPRIRIELGSAAHYEVRIEHRPSSAAPRRTGRISGGTNPATTLVEYESDGLRYWKALPLPPTEHRRPAPARIEATEWQPIDLQGCYNACVTDIFRNEYRSNRSGTTTLQIPLHGYGEWCHPTDTVAIDDSGLRAELRKAPLDDRTGLIEADCDGTPIPFRMAHTGANVCYTSLWSQYPDRLTVPLSGSGSQLAVVLAGSTNHMQCRISNGRLRIRYADGSEEAPFELVNPDTWAPIEQIGCYDLPAFDCATGGGTLTPLLRMHLGSGRTSRRLDQTFGIEGVADRRIPDGAALVLLLPTDPARELASLEIETLSNDVVIGLMAVSVGRTNR